MTTHTLTGKILDFGDAPAKVTRDGTHLSDAGMAHMAAQVPAWLAAAGIT